jgi:hypothetical protein
MRKDNHVQPGKLPAIAEHALGLCAGLTSLSVLERAILAQNMHESKPPLYCAKRPYDGQGTVRQFKVRFFLLVLHFAWCVSCCASCMLRGWVLRVACCLLRVALPHKMRRRHAHTAAAKSVYTRSAWQLCRLVAHTHDQMQTVYLIYCMTSSSAKCRHARPACCLA